jgi:hypothetical protein
MFEKVRGAKMEQENTTKLDPFFGGAEQKAEPKGQETDGQLALEEGKREEIGGYLGSNGEAVCEVCTEQYSVSVQNYDFFPGAPGWPCFTCEYCGGDF